jgi:EAL domain-containing protein (putative c-di-GMP-specific phosphodiesterase class I)/ActR/RegA family two-component response regulator
MPCSNLHFLVVEDHEFQRKMLVSLLTNLGAAMVYGAADGNEALEIVRDSGRPVDIVVSDLQMPGMDGMELIRNLGESGVAVSLIIASALEPRLLASVASMARAYKVELLGVMGKPPTAAKLARLVDQHRALKQKTQKGVDTAFTLFEISEAWARDEFEPLFEPKVELATSRVRGMRATPHWRHPARGVLAPEVFLPSIQAFGLNDDLVWLMLRKSAAACSRWRVQGLRLRVAVNLSLASLTDTELAGRMQKIAQKENVEPRHILLGIDESTVNTELGKALENLVRLRVAGFGLAIDNFGSGQMSPEQLASIAFTELKISRAFVEGADRDEAVRVGLAVALDMARQLHVVSVANGISTRGEWDLLREWGCDFGQGSLISGPLAVGAVEGWVQKWNDEHALALPVPA